MAIEEVGLVIIVLVVGLASLIKLTRKARVKVGREEWMRRTSWDGVSGSWSPGSLWDWKKRRKRRG